MYAVQGDAIDQVVTVSFQLPYDDWEKILKSEEWNRLHALVEETQKANNMKPMYPWLHL